MSEATQAIRGIEAEMVRDTTHAIADDIELILAEAAEQFGSVTPEIGAGLEDILPLTDTRIRVKRAVGYVRPDAARVATGSLLHSIDAVETGELTGVVFTEDPAAFVQQFGGGSWTDEFGQLAPFTPPRPFFGVSDRALEKVDARVQSRGQDIVNALQSINLGTVEVPLSV